MSSVSERNQLLVQQLRDALGQRIVAITEHRRQLTVEISHEHWLDAAYVLRDEPALAFEQLSDLCGIDYLGYGDDEWETGDATRYGYSRAADALGPGRFAWSERPVSGDVPNRFAVIVHLLSLQHNRRLRLRCFAPDDELPVLPSLVEVWNSVNWYEREAFDLFGIAFEGHPDLRRLLTDYGFIGHPFRKDFPLIGNVTVRYDEDKGRVIYEPVEIEPRVTVARVVRRDSRYVDQGIDGGEK
ncbi:NADH-quinone oxidoreductase subunit C [Wenzhouxiangella sp. AB-CW3]|uniref:NADH-quinone oxidoreductase subunit C n=1 Tax=Wenzhouxiangella sp. AB-CW3 TaxID=2771012 RepID=UPI00168A64B7|nr:NADH-quinone oxidoreductase subunit C [Wenzhouxiangella sp. AB-CW3]QOC22088.1 NADH-quinone oxidoreductase subunit C [Wenzhouxiangella sp. AB-CW3]